MKTLIFIYLLSGVLLQVSSPKFIKIQDTDLFLYIMGFMLLLPEIVLIVSKKFRTWIREGIENSDGRLESRDVKEMMGHYFSLWCIRLFVIISLFSVLRSLPVNSVVITLSFSGAMGMEAILIINKILKVRKE